MGDTTNLLKSSYTLIQQATMYDRAGNYGEALRLYMTGLEGFISALKIEKNERIKDTLRAKMNEYLGRCEQLKELQKNKSSMVSTSPCCVQTHQPAQSPIAQPPLMTVNNSSGSNDIDLLLPSVPTARPTAPYIPNPKNATPEKGGSRVALSKKIENGQIGCSYDSLFGEYIIGGSQFVVEDPYIRSKHQIDNFIRFCELVVKKTCKYNNTNQCKVSTNPILIQLVTSSESPAQESELRRSFQEIADHLSPSNIHLQISFSKTLHDRSIDINNGYKIKLGRGLDFYQKPNSKLSIGTFDYDLRPCFETNIDILYAPPQ